MQQGPHLDGLAQGPRVGSVCPSQGPRVSGSVCLDPGACQASLPPSALGVPRSAARSVSPSQLPSLPAQAHVPTSLQSPAAAFRLGLPGPAWGPRILLRRTLGPRLPLPGGLTSAGLPSRLCSGRRVRLVLRGCGGSSLYTCCRLACLQLGASAVPPPFLGTPSWCWLPPGAHWHLAHPHQAGRTYHEQCPASLSPRWGWGEQSFCQSQEVPPCLLASQR